MQLWICEMLGMTYEEFRRQLGKAGITVKGFAHLLKQNPNSITNHAVTGEVPAHIAIIAALLAELAEHGIDYSAVLNRIDYSASKPRGLKTKNAASLNRNLRSSATDGHQGHS